LCTWLGVPKAALRWLVVQTKQTCGDAGETRHFAYRLTLKGRVAAFGSPCSTLTSTRHQSGKRDPIWATSGATVNALALLPPFAPPLPAFPCALWLVNSSSNPPLTAFASLTVPKTGVAAEDAQKHLLRPCRRVRLKLMAALTQSKGQETGARNLRLGLLWLMHSSISPG